MHIDLHKKLMALAVAGTFFLTPVMGFAADTGDINDLIQNQQQILNQLNKEQARKQEEDANRVIRIEQQMDDLKKRSNYDAEGAITGLSAQVNALQKQVMAQIEAQSKLLQELKDMKEKQEAQLSSGAGSVSVSNAVESRNFLVNPGPRAEVSFTQDAVNAQGNSTMVFAYAPNQLYKIYCRVGYLTDLAFKPGEKITFVGGGDTSAWMIDSTEVDGTPHLYIKPIQPNATTNLIVNTTKHSYQIIANAGDWYNPMVRWSYSSEEQLARQLQVKADEKIYTGSLDVTSPEHLNFAYEIKGDRDWKPSMVFDDGKKTYIKFDRLNNQMPVLFIKEPNRKEVTLVNYKVKDNCFIVDKVFKEAQLRVNDKETIKIIAKNK